MKKQFLPFSLFMIPILTMQPAVAGGASQHFSDALDHSGQAVANSTISGLKLVSGAIAIPLTLVGEVGKVSGEVGEDLWNEANTTLPVTEEVITVRPTPAQAMSEEE